VSSAITDHLDAVDVRPIQPHDLDFLRLVYCASREDEMAQATHWNDEQKTEFLHGQFELQHRHYVEHYPGASLSLVTIAGRGIGRLYVDRREDEIRLMDIALLPEFRNQGIGQSLIQGLVDEARRTNKLLSCYVEDSNPAKRLYERLGFVEAGQHTFYRLMHCRP
jgi:ribosomal protein S18 acetylase RimI-like enzyme